MCAFHTNSLKQGRPHSHLRGDTAEPQRQKDSVRNGQAVTGKAGIREGQVPDLWGPVEMRVSLSKSRKKVLLKELKYKAFSFKKVLLLIKYPGVIAITE